MHELVAKLPKRAFIGLLEFRIEVVTEPIEDGDCDGQTDLATRHVQIHRDLPFKRFVNVVLHELVHAINFDQGTTDMADEETFTNNLANGLTQFYLDNPRFASWFDRAFKAIRKEQANG